MKLELCCGGHTKKGFVGLDIKKTGDTKIICDLNKEELPFDDNSIDEIYEQNSFYELENPMKVINECHRVLKDGGILEFREMYFASHYAYTPLTKNFWNFATARIWTKGYRYAGMWEIIKIDFEESLLPKWLINLNRNCYEKHFSRVFPITYIRYKLKKVRELN